MISKSTVLHIAHLAKLKTGEAEAEKYAGELSRVLDYVDQLKEVDTAKVIPTAQVTGLTNNLRADKVAPWDEAETELALKQAEVVENNLIKVPKII
jgi:aspartyl-tRNA(Asn)/glutamyl-tRNA(Gln) amidotransferase subunit C